MTAPVAPETLARRSARCRLCKRPIRAGVDYIAKAEPIGWVHAHCSSGYRAAMAESAEVPR